MAVFGVIMFLAVVQLFIVGSIIQRGKSALIPNFMLKDIENNKGYCRAFGNKLILLSLIALVCGIMSLMARTFTMRPILIFGSGIILVLILLTIDHYKFKLRKVN